MLITIALTAGLVMSIILAVIVLVSLAQNPRIWLRRIPKIVQDAVTPLSDAEQRQLKLWAIPIFGVMFLMPLATAYWYEQSYHQLSYGEAFLFIYIMYMVFNLVDLLIIDWLILVWWLPDWSITPEVKPLMHHLGYAYHFKGFLKGIVIVAVLALIVAGVMMLI